MYDEDSQLDPVSAPTGSRRGLVAMTLMVPLAAVASLVVGFGAGGLVGWYAKPAPEVAVAEPTYDLADIRFQQACLPMVAENATKIEELNLKLGDLRNEMAVKQERLDELEAKASRSKGAEKVATTAELRKAREELASLKQQVASLTSEKEQMVAALTQTRQQLEVAEVAVAQNRAAYEEQITFTRAAQDDATSNKYSRFLGESQLNICEKGGRKKMGDCRTEVLAKLQEPALKDQFMQCVRTGQALPTVRENTSGGALPAHSATLGGSKVLKGWYVSMCDPTLPEARVASARPAEYTPMSALQSAASYLPSASAVYAAVMPSAMAAPTSASLPDSFVPDAPATGRLDVDDEVAGNAYFPPVEAPPAPVQVASAPAYVPPAPAYAPPAPVAASNAQYADVLDIDDILGPDDPAGATPSGSASAAPAKASKDAPVQKAVNGLGDDDFADLPEE